MAKIRVTVDIQGFDKVGEESIRGLRRRLTPLGMYRLFRYVLMVTLLRAYKARFEANFETMKDTKRMRPTTDMEPLDRQEAFEELQELREKLSEYARTGNVDAVSVVNKRVQEITRELYSADYDPDDLGGIPMGTSFTGPMNRILSALTDTKAIELVSQNEDEMVLGIGNLARLDAIKTPDIGSKRGEATKSGQTFSEFNILWRHLEFGTGIYAKKRRVSGITKHPGGGGSWWVGENVGRGLHIAGSHPGNFLTDSSGIPYTKDGLQFGERLARSLSSVLRGGSHRV